MKKLNLEGMVFERWHVIEEGEKAKDGHVRWWCWCDCEKDLPFEERRKFLVYGSSLNKGKSLSCGCLTTEKSRIKNKKYNEYEEKENYIVGKISSGKMFYIDKEDFPLISKYCWSINSRGYLVTGNPDCDFSVMHRLIMNVTDPLIQVDHINHNKLDNRKQNLRLCKNINNVKNKKKQKHNTSGVTGVSWHTRDHVWQSYITVNGKRIYLGRFDKDKFEDAVKARKEAEEKYFGEWSYDNSQKIWENLKVANNW